MDKLPITKRDPKTGKTLVGRTSGSASNAAAPANSTRKTEPEKNTLPLLRGDARIDGDRMNNSVSDEIVAGPRLRPVIAR